MSTCPLCFGSGKTLISGDCPRCTPIGSDPVSTRTASGEGGSTSALRASAPEGQRVPLHCPHCAGDPEVVETAIDDVWWVRCTNRDCIRHRVQPYGREAAIAAWNCRAPVNHAASVEAGQPSAASAASAPEGQSTAHEMGYALTCAERERDEAREMHRRLLTASTQRINNLERALHKAWAALAVLNPPTIAASVSGGQPSADGAASAPEGMDVLRRLRAELAQVSPHSAVASIEALGHEPTPQQIAEAIANTSAALPVATAEGIDAMTSLRALHREACALMDHSTGGSRSHAFFQRAAVTLAVLIEAMTQAPARIPSAARAALAPDGIGARAMVADAMEGELRRQIADLQATIRFERQQHAEASEKHAAEYHRIATALGCHVHDDLAAKAAEARGAGAATPVPDGIDALDLMRDEFLRIQAIVGPDSEIGGLCDRAITKIHQRVPVIVQRDNLRESWIAARHVVFAAREVCSAWPADLDFGKPGTSIGNLRDVVTAYDQRHHEITPAATPPPAGPVLSMPIPRESVGEVAAVLGISNPEEVDAGWLATWQRLPDEEQVVELAVLSGGDAPYVYRAFGCRTDPGDGWVWALATYGIPDHPKECEADDDYDVIAWRRPTSLPDAPAARRFKILRDRGEDGQEEVAIVTGRDVAHAKMQEIGLAARCEELPPTEASADADDAPDLRDTEPLPPPSWMGA